MIPAIVYRAGHSGQFLRALILDYPASNAKFRMPDYYQTSDVFLTHELDIVLTDKKYNPVFRILPTNNIYQAIYNIFMKKILVEEFPEFELKNWSNNPVFWYDKCYYHIAEYYSAIQNDIASNTIANVVDFDRLTDVNYMSSWLLEHFNIKLNSNRRAMIENYAALQLNAKLTNRPMKNIEEILQPITDQMLLENPWYWAYVIFKYENDNNLTEAQRLWSVDSIRIPQSLLDIRQYQYQLSC